MADVRATTIQQEQRPNLFIRAYQEHATVRFAVNVLGGVVIGAAVTGGLGYLAEDAMFDRAEAARSAAQLGAMIGGLGGVAGFVLKETWREDSPSQDSSPK